MGMTRTPRPLTLLGPDGKDPTDELAARVEHTRELVWVACPDCRGARAAFIAASRTEEFLVELRRHPTPFLNSPLARLARRQMPDHNPKAPAELHGHVRRLDDLPDELELRCIRRACRLTIPRAELTSALTRARSRGSTTIAAHPATVTAHN